MKNSTSFLRRVLFTVVLGMSIGFAQAVSPSQAIIDLVKAEVQAAQYSLPAYVTPGLQLTKVWYIPEKHTIAYKYIYDVSIPRPSNSAISETKKGMVHMMKASPNSKEMIFLTNGISYHYNYYNPDGTFLYAVKISPSDL